MIEMLLKCKRNSRVSFET